MPMMIPSSFMHSIMVIDPYPTICHFISTRTKVGLIYSCYLCTECTLVKVELAIHHTQAPFPKTNVMILLQLCERYSYRVVLNDAVPMFVSTKQTLIISCRALPSQELTKNLSTLSLPPLSTRQNNGQF